MSFFADLLAGGAVGLGQGMTAQYQSDQQEKLRQEALEEKRQLAIQLASQRSEDMRYRVDADSRNKIDALALREAMFNGGGGGGGSGSGGNGGAAGATNVMERMIMGAKTPEEQAQAVRYVKARAGEEAAATVAEFYGKPLTRQVEEFDPVAAEKLSRRDYAVANPDVDTVQTVDRAVKGTDAGTAALNRLLAMANPANYKGFVEGERGAGLIDAGGKAAATGKTPVESAELLQRYSDPASRVAQVEARGEAQVEAAGIRGGAQVKAAEIRGASGGGSGRAGGSTEKLTTQRNSLAATIKSMEGSMSRSALAKDERYQAAIKDVAEIDSQLREKRNGGAAAPATTSDKLESWVRGSDGKLKRAN